MPAGYHKHRFTVNNTDWTPIITEYNCNGFGLISSNRNSFLIRTIVDDEQTEDIVPAGMGEVLPAASAKIGFKLPMSSRFKAGTTICYVKATVSSDVIIGTFTQ